MNVLQITIHLYDGTAELTQFFLKTKDIKTSLMNKNEHNAHIRIEKMKKYCISVNLYIESPEGFTLSDSMQAIVKVVHLEYHRE